MMHENLIQIIIRVSKENSSFVYFLLEGHDGMCFYSTLDFEKGQAYRDLELNSPIELKNELEHFIAEISKKFSVEILKKEVITDKNSQHKKK